MITVLQALYFMLPAYFANMAPVIFKWIPFGQIPIDGGRSWEKNRIFGDHKTYRGFICGILAAITTVYIQRMFPWEGVSILKYENLSLGHTLLTGFLFGFGALGGDAIKSFFKRRFAIGDGKSWMPFDQLDFVIGSLLAVSFIYIPSALHIIIILISTPLLHFAGNILSYSLKIKKVWW